VARVYTELEREGILNTRPGLGVFVARPKAELTKKVRKERLAELLDHFLTEAVHLGFSADEVVALATEQVKHFQWHSENPAVG
jgi:GntR family transcriptional regulator